MAFWYRWPSWLVELLAGLLVATLVQPIAPFLLRGLVALAMSVYYEVFLDPNAGKSWHHPWKDLAQRAVGIKLGLVAWWLIRG